MFWAVLFIIITVLIGIALLGSVITFIMELCDGNKVLIPGILTGVFTLVLAAFITIIVCCCEKSDKSKLFTVTYNGQVYTDLYQGTFIDEGSKFQTKDGDWLYFPKDIVIQEQDISNENK